MSEPYVAVKNLVTRFDLKGSLLSKRRVVKAVEDVSFEIGPGETLGIVGESGCGKSTLGRTLAGIIRPRSGSMVIGGRDVASLKGKELFAFRKDVQMIFQDPYSSLNPRMTAGEIIREPMIIHRLHGSRENQREKTGELLSVVGLKPDHASRFPHEFSGGQRQRIAIARALALSPRFIVCDEPVSALDVSVQAQILNLLKDVQRRTGATYMFIAHDIGAVRHVSDRIAVMYLGRIVEIGQAASLYSDPWHPYTKALLSAVPVPDPVAGKAMRRVILQGETPSPIDMPDGCAFASRCTEARDECLSVTPSMSLIGTRMIACHNIDRPPQD